ncbi:hypothetical protein DWUX_1727 [Desulfovibrio diazotrophicus]|nr:hypothetical protein DWUX_1727 [Desulfovibrio diazotrophicus]VVU42955.1 hypothetical protein DWUX_301 [Desulfovibrio diazotrophicus]
MHDFLAQKWQQQTKNKQIIGNQGLHFVSFVLARKGFNVAITSRNAKGADILIYNEGCSIVKTIQIKSITIKQYINVGQTSEKFGPEPKLMCDYWVFVNLSYAYPRCSVYTKEELQPLVTVDNNPGKAGKWSWWLPSNVSDNCLDEWDKIQL